MKGAKVRRMWAKDMIEGWGAHKEILQCVTSQPCRLDHGYLPVFIVPATPEAMELLATKLLNHLNKDCDSEYEMFTIEQAKAALSAVFGKGSRWKDA